MICGQNKECLNIQVYLYEGLIDEQHDLLYLVPQPDDFDEFGSINSY